MAQPALSAPLGRPDYRPGEGEDARRVETTTRRFRPVWSRGSAHHRSPCSLAPPARDLSLVRATARRKGELARQTSRKRHAGAMEPKLGRGIAGLLAAWLAGTVVLPQVLALDVEPELVGSNGVAGGTAVEVAISATHAYVVVFEFG